MLRAHYLVFDDYLYADEPACSGVEHMEALARGDHLALHVVLTNSAAEAAALAAGGTFTAAIEHSLDGRRWVAKSTTPEIDAAPIEGASLYGGERHPAPPSLPYVRLRLSITGARSVHAQVFVAVRDRSVSRFDACACPGDR
jgi:hypothetical protein